MKENLLENVQTSRKLLFEDRVCNIMYIVPNIHMQSKKSLKRSTPNFICVNYPRYGLGHSPIHSKGGCEKIVVE